MGFLSGVIGVVFLIYLLLRISRMLGSSTSGRVIPSESYDTRPKLPTRSETEIQTILDSMPTKWLIYEGSTPPLNIRVRGLSREFYRRFWRNHLDTMQNYLDTLPPKEKQDFVMSQTPNVNALAYVVEWNGALYPNGNPLPGTVDNLAVLIRKDEMLRNFISEESGKISPDWSKD